MLGGTLLCCELFRKAESLVSLTVDGGSKLWPGFGLSLEGSLRYEGSWAPPHVFCKDFRNKGLHVKCLGLRSVPVLDVRDRWGREKDKGKRGFPSGMTKQTDSLRE